MGLCRDKSVNYLADLGLNTILHPQQGIAPLALLGEAGGQRALIGTLDQLVSDPTDMPQITSAIAGNINGQRSSKLPVELGLNVLGNIIGAMGGNLGINAAYEDAKQVEFQFSSVTRDRANVIGIGDFLESAEIRWHHPILELYLFGEGNLYVLTEVIRSKELSVIAYRNRKTSLALEVPVVQEIVGGNVKVGVEDESKTAISYKGDVELAFGFVAIELSAGENHEGELDLVLRPSKPGSITLSASAPQVDPKLFDGPLLNLPIRELAA